MEYKIDNGARIPQPVHTIVISAQHTEGVTKEEMKKQLKKDVIDVCCEILLSHVPAFSKVWSETNYILQHFDSFVTGGPMVGKLACWLNNL